MEKQYIKCKIHLEYGTEYCSNIVSWNHNLSIKLSDVIIFMYFLFCTKDVMIWRSQVDYSTVVIPGSEKIYCNNRF